LALRVAVLRCLDDTVDDRRFYLVGVGEWDKSWSWGTPLLDPSLRTSTAPTLASEEDVNALWTCMQDEARQGPFPDQPQRVEITVHRN